MAFSRGVAQLKTWFSEEATFLRTGIPPRSEVTASDIAAFLPAHRAALRRDGGWLGLMLLLANLSYGALDDVTFGALPEAKEVVRRGRSLFFLVGVFGFAWLLLAPNRIRLLYLFVMFSVPIIFASQFAHLGPPSDAWYHFAYPFMLGPLTCYFAPKMRIAVSFGLVMAMLGAYFGRAPHYLADPLAMATILFSTFCGFIVTVYGLHVDRIRLMNFSAMRALQSERGQLVEQVHARTADLSALAQRLDAELEAERQHMARELHDELAQWLAATRVTLRLAERRATTGAPSILPNLQSLAMLLDRLTDQIRTLLLRLRAPVVEQLGLEGAIRALADEMADIGGVPHRVMVDGTRGDLSIATATALYRCVQEALANCARHVAARSVEIEMRWQEESVEVEVRDDGCGMSAETPGGLGLIGMAERARAVGGEERAREGGGRATWSSSPAGTRVLLSAPRTQGQQP